MVTGAVMPGCSHVKRRSLSVRIRVNVPLQPASHAIVPPSRTSCRPLSPNISANVAVSVQAANTLETGAAMVLVQHTV
ncbi:MAG: hypothetical protein H3C58_11765 [Fimbriimonadaceae bacterium]|nr:hypothetical protein [Fimbriimonadaceae bacterium]